MFNKKIKNVDYLVEDMLPKKLLAAVFISCLTIITGQAEAEQDPMDFTSMGNLSMSSGLIGLIGIRKSHFYFWH